MGDHLNKKLRDLFLTLSNSFPHTFLIKKAVSFVHGFNYHFFVCLFPVPQRVSMKNVCLIVLEVVARKNIYDPFDHYIRWYVPIHGGVMCPFSTGGCVFHCNILHFHN